VTPEQEQMFRIQNAPTAGDISSHRMGHVDSMVEEQGVEEVNHGLALGMQYMAQNGPTQSIHRGKAKMMTKQQLEEQRMNEAKGLPSNLEEAGRVVGLEQKVSQISDNVSQLALVMSQFIQSQQKPTMEPFARGNVGQLLTPPVKPVAEPLLLGQNPISAERNVQQLALLDPPTGPPTQGLPTQESVPDSSPPVTPPPVSQETKPLIPTSMEQLERDRTVPDLNEIPEKYYDAIEVKGKIVYTERKTCPTPNMSYGPVGTPGPVVENFDRFRLTEESSPGLDVSVLVEEEEPQEDAADQKRLGRQQILTDQVTDWLKSKDPHKFWRQFIAGSCNKNLSYNTWPKEFQDPFNERFQAMITDPIFIASLCGKVVKFQNGHLVAAHVMGAFIVATAGFLSLALIEV